MSIWGKVKDKATRSCYINRYIFHSTLNELQESLGVTYKNAFYGVCLVSVNLHFILKVANKTSKV